MTPKQPPLIEEPAHDGPLLDECVDKWNEMAWAVGSPPCVLSDFRIHRAVQRLYRSLGLRQTEGPPVKLLWFKSPERMGAMIDHLAGAPDGLMATAMCGEFGFRFRTSISALGRHDPLKTSSPSEAYPAHLALVKALRFERPSLVRGFEYCRAQWAREARKRDEMSERNLSGQWRPNFLADCLISQFNCGWLAWADWGRRVGLIPPGGKTDSILTIMERCTTFLPFPDACLLLSRPSRIKRDGEGRLHSMEGEAIGWPVHEPWYFFRGRPIAAGLACKSAPLAQLIADVRDASLQREMIDWYGEARFAVEAADDVKTDDFGTLYWVQLNGNEDFAVVRVLNSTPEPDGTFKDYFIRVPHWVQTPREAVAWTFGFNDARAYAPVAQT